MELEFLGHAGFSITLSDGTALAIDPWLADAGNPVATRSADELNPDVILLTHGHADHMSSVPELARRTGALVIGTADLVGYLQDEEGVENVHGMNLGGAYSFHFGSVRLTPAFHGAGIAGDHAAGIVLTADNYTFYHAGDTALFSDMRLIADRYDLDAVALPIGSNFTMDMVDAARAVSWLEPGIVIPIHYNTFPPIQCDPEAFKELVAGESDAQVYILAPGESIRLQAVL